MATNKRVFTLRLDDEVFERIGALATAEHRSMTNYIEFVLLKHLEELGKSEQEKKEKARLGAGVALRRNGRDLPFDCADRGLPHSLKRPQHHHARRLGAFGQAGQRNQVDPRSLFGQGLSGRDRGGQ